MFKYLLTGLLALFLSACAQASEPRYIGSTKEYIRISTEPCTSAFVKNRTKPEFASKLLDAVYVAQGQRPIKGCYIVHEGLVHLMFEDGDTVSFEAEAFSSVLAPPGARQAM